MATQKVHIYDLLSEAQTTAKSHFRHYLPLFMLFILPFSFSIVAYPTLQHSLATPPSNSYLFFPFNGDPIVFKPLTLFLLYISTLLCLSVCAIGTFTYSLYHGSSDQPVKSVDAIKSLSNSLMRLFATFFCAHAIIFAGLLVIGLIVSEVTREIEYLLGFEIQYHGVCFWVVYVLCRVLLGLGLLCLYADWVLAPVIVVAESSWGLEPLKRSASLVKGNRGVVVRLLVSICSLTWLILLGFGSCEFVIPFGSSVSNSTWVIVSIAVGSCMLSTHLLHSLIAITILYKKCKAMQEGLPVQIKDDVNREYISLSKVPYIV